MRDGILKKVLSLNTPNYLRSTNTIKPTEESQKETGAI
jgi:hypothetical protein